MRTISSIITSVKNSTEYENINRKSYKNISIKSKSFQLNGLNLANPAEMQFKVRVLVYEWPIKFE